MYNVGEPIFSGRPAGTRPAKLCYALQLRNGEFMGKVAPSPYLLCKSY
jgi:hypothetical protein